MKHQEHFCRFNDGEQTCECYDKGFEAGKDSMKKEILNKLPERKSENKKKKDQEEWINIPRIQRAVGFNSCLNQIKDIIKNV